MGGKSVHFSLQTILMYYHTSLRNIGLYTSLSLATLAASRFHRDKSFMLNISLIIVSIVFNLISTAIGLYMLSDIRHMRANQEEQEKDSLVNKWTLLPNVTIVINSCIILTSLYVLYEQVTKKK
jgi:uncharacterized membrane protein YidH (DUF202 family)